MSIMSIIIGNDEIKCYYYSIGGRAKLYDLLWIIID